MIATILRFTEGPAGRFRRVFDLESILESRPPAAGSIKVIGIDGHGGSGKSTLAALLGGWLGAEIVHTDDFASWDNPKDWWPLVIERIFDAPAVGSADVELPTLAVVARTQALTHRRSAGHRCSDPRGSRVTTSRVPPVLECSIFVSAPREVCIERGTTRDAAMGTKEEALERWNKWFDDEVGYMSHDEPDCSQTSSSVARRPLRSS